MLQRRCFQWYMLAVCFRCCLCLYLCLCLCLCPTWHCSPCAGSTVQAANQFANSHASHLSPMHCFFSRDYKMKILKLTWGCTFFKQVLRESCNLVVSTPGHWSGFPTFSLVVYSWGTWLVNTWCSRVPQLTWTQECWGTWLHLAGLELWFLWE